MGDELNWVRYDAEWQRHHERYAAHVEAHGLLCQDCGGAGDVLDDVIDGYYRIYSSCGWCEGTGRITRHVRGLWLRMKREEKREALAARGGGG